MAARSADGALTAFLAHPTQATREELKHLAAAVRRIPIVRSVSTGDLRDLLQLILDASDLLDAVTASGLTYVLDHAIGDRYAEVERLTTRIGASDTAAYLAAGRGRVPNGHIPNDRSARHAMLAAFEEDVGDLDRTYRTAVLQELPRCLAQYLAAEADAVRQQLREPLAAPDAITSADAVLPGRDDLVRKAAIHAEYLTAITTVGRASTGFAPEVVRIGDVVAMRGRRRLAYVQATHAHAFSAWEGPVVRVLPGLHREPLALDALATLVAGETAYFALAQLDAYVADGSAEIVANLPVPASAHPFPVFRYRVGLRRDGRMVWGLWRGDATGTGERIVEPLSPAQRAIFVRDEFSPGVLEEALSYGWSPSDEVEDRALHEGLGADV